MDEFVIRFLGEQRNRMVGSIMGYLEREVWPHLDDNERRALRAKVLQSAGVYHDACRDMLKASVRTDGETGVLINQHALELIQELHEHVVR